LIPNHREFLSELYAREKQHKKRIVAGLIPKPTPPRGESENQRLKRRKDKLIRLDDVIPKQDVTG